MVDYIIVGSGIGAFSICKRLADESKEFVIISDFKHSATSVAGGIINPIILKRFKPFWNALGFYDEAIRFYNHLQNQYDNQFFSKKKILRIFASIEEQNNWYAASDQPVLNQFLQPDSLNPPDSIKSDYKSGQMNKAFLVDVQKLLKLFHQMFSAPIYQVKKFDHSQVAFQEDFIKYKDLKSKRIIFTEGAQVMNNPFFSFLPIYGNRGDYLIFKSKELNVNTLVKSKYFLIPLGNNLYKFGASFDRNVLVHQAPLEFQDSLIESLKNMIQVDFEVVRFESGIRPNVKDRRPILGQHPVHKNLYIMNGFGSRGIFMSPLLSKWLFNYMESASNLPEEVNVKRFFEHF